MPLDKLGEYVESVQAASGEAAEGLTIRLGIEADFIPEMSGVLSVCSLRNLSTT